MEGPYQLLTSLIAHDGPIRCITIGPATEAGDMTIITGCQSDSPNYRTWQYQKTVDVQLEELGSCVFHDHWVTAVTALQPNPSRSCFPQGCIITGCMDSKIRIFGIQGNLLLKLTGHTKGVISFSFLEIDSNSPKLVSGSWDGTARIWDLTTQLCIQELGPHENGVQVLGLTNGTLATTSTGESVNGKPANYKLRLWNPTTGKQIGESIEDHGGSIRCLAAVPGIDGFVTGANDGFVVLRSIEGQQIGTMPHLTQADGSPPFILSCCATDSNSGMDIVSCGEDGSVMVWCGTEMVQSIPHPNTVWAAVALPGTNGDFITAGHDGVIRLFTRDPVKYSTAKAQAAQSEFLMEVEQAKQKKSQGPSQEEIAKAPRWEERGAHPGRAENDVMVFNKDGALIAAQWSSGSWIIVGEVTGKGDGDYIDGVWYDRVMPVEFETPQGVANLKLGYNNGENPFVAAQRFIDQHQLGQHYLGQIADWIQARSGQTMPTIGAAPPPAAAAPRVAPAAAAPVPPVPRVSYSQSLNALSTYEDIPAAQKLLPKLMEFNSNAGSNSITSMDAIEATLQTLSNTGYYHSSIIPSSNLSILLSAATTWQPDVLFPVLDIIRLVAIHPNGATNLSTHPQLTAFIERLLSLLNEAVDTLPNATVLTGLRCCCNLFKINELRAYVWKDGILLRLINACSSQIGSKNKLIRVGASRCMGNIACIGAGSTGMYASFNLQADTIRSILVKYCAEAAFAREVDNAEVIYTASRIVGTLLTSSTVTAVGSDAKMTLQPLVENLLNNSEWVQRLGEAGIGSLKEVLNILQKL